MRRTVFTDAPPATIISGEAAKKKIEQQRMEDSKKVRGKFINMKEPGRKVKLPYFKYKTDVWKMWELHHGKEYEIPKGFANQLNGLGYDGYNEIKYTPAMTAPARTMDELVALDPIPIVTPIYQFIEY